MNYYQKCRHKKRAFYSERVSDSMANHKPFLLQVILRRSILREHKTENKPIHDVMVANRMAVKISSEK